MIGEKGGVFRRKFRILLQKFMQKGKERLTVMFIPHSEKKIFNLHISNFTLFFVLIGISLIITIAIFSIEKQETTYKRQVAYQSANYQIKTQINKFVEITNRLVLRTDKVSRTVDDLIKLTRLSSGSHFVDPQAQGGPAIPVNQTNSAQNIEEINSLKKVHSETTVLGQKIMRLSNHMRRFGRIMNNFPSIWPLVGGGTVVREFGAQMNDFTGRMSLSPGITIKAFSGTPVRATANGTVTKIGYSNKYGLYCVIKHGYLITTRYGYFQSTKVKVGMTVKKGSVIGYVGRTGAALDYGLCYEVRIGTSNVDPKNFINLDNYW